MLSWKAIYKDGASFPQFNRDGSENKYLDINRSKLSQFHLIKDDKPVVIVYLDEDKKLICRRRVAKHFSGPKAGIEEVVWIVGWQENRRGINVQMICFVFEDGHVEVLDRFDEKHPWFYPIVFREEEKI